ncbi:MDR family MFS transporter [Bifidobacterium asteroides]|uniref:MFS transporter n=1 Tax=Bifidobacterium asteroides TaxID=1684 RepID=A0A318M564_9BIFI|nr:MDR family MFS transporter [Bifidobacterium asteroides]PXY82566.1 MFS transporter [Bifidobacterium asteroides]
MSQTVDTGSGRKTNRTLVTVAVFIATFMTAIEGTIVSTAMPTIIGDLHGLSIMNWVYSIYLLMTAVTTPIYGKLSDRFGRKPLLTIGLLVFVIGSTLCALSQSMPQLIGARFLQGLGAGAIQPLTYTVLADIYPLDKRAGMIGLNGSAWGIASIIAPLLGGFIVQQISWHWVFAINVPIGLLVIVMIQLFLSEHIQKRESRIDYMGIGLLSVSLICLMLCLQSLGSAGNVRITLILAVATMVTFALLLHVEGRQEDPILPLRLFRIRTFVIQNICMLLVAGFLMGFDTYMPIWMQSVLGMNPSLGGFVVTPSSILWLLGAYLAGPLTMHHPPHRATNIGLAFILTACVCYIAVPQATAYWAFLLISAVVGFGFGLTITTSTITAQSVVPSGDVGASTSFNTLARSLGQTLMVSIFGIVMNTVIAREVPQHKGLTEDMMNSMINPATAGSIPSRLLGPARTIVFDGLHWIFLVGLVILIMALVANLCDIRSHTLLAEYQNKATTAAPAIAEKDKQ